MPAQPAQDECHFKTRRLPYYPDTIYSGALPESNNSLKVQVYTQTSYLIKTDKYLEKRNNPDGDEET